MQILNIEDNKLCDKSIIKILEPLCFNQSLRILNISKNKLTD